MSIRNVRHYEARPRLRLNDFIPFFTFEALDLLHRFTGISAQIVYRLPFIRQTATLNVFFFFFPLPLVALLRYATPSDSRYSYIYIYINHSHGTFTSMSAFRLTSDCTPSPASSSGLEPEAEAEAEAGRSTPHHPHASSQPSLPRQTRCTWRATR